MPARRSRGQELNPAPRAARKRDLAWWSSEPGARRKAEEEFRRLPDDMQGQLLGAIKRYMDDASRPGDTTKLDEHIWEWRAHKGNNHFRVLFFVWGHICVALTAFYKNQQKTPPEDLKRANDRRKRWVAARGAVPGDDWAGV
jgi:phage-related protein